MKRFKRLLAVVMVMMMLFTTIPMTSAGAKETYPKLMLNAPSSVNIGIDGMTFTFKPEKDGTYKFYSIGGADSIGLLYDSDDLFVYNDNVDSTNKNFSVSTKLKAGVTYYLDVYVNSEEPVNIQIAVEETIGVDSIEITQYPFDTTVVEDYEYETYEADGLKATFTFTDGSVFDWEYNKYDMFNGKNYVNGFMVNVYFGYDYQDNCYVYLECGGVEKAIPYTIVESPVESIEYICDTPIECYENSNGYWMEDNTYYYYYDIPKDAVLKINYKDGTSKTASFDDEVDGVYFNDYDYQETSELWKVGSENYFYIEYLNVNVAVPVTILPSPFKSVTLNSAPTRDYFFGDYEYGDYESLENENEYTLYPYDLTGLSFTVEYEDGTTKTFDDDDIDSKEMTIDGYAYELTEPTMTGPGEYEVTLYYKGAKIKYNVDVLETYIDSIEIVKGPDKTEYEDRYYADYTGAVVRINYKDGTSAQAEVNEDTLLYTHDGWWFTRQIKVGDDIVSIYDDLDFDTMELFDLFTCAGAKVNYRGVKYTDSRDVKAITAENVTLTGDGMVVTVEYKDGSSEELHFDTVSYFDYKDGMVDAFAMTENGIVAFTVEEAYDTKGNFAGFGLSAFDCVYLDKAEIGDVDRDSVVSIMDATEIQMIIAQKKPAPKEKVLADVDLDGQISIMDATAIQFKVAKKQ